jgi:transketolase
MKGYGASALFQTLYKTFGITAEKVAEEARAAVR